MNCKRNKTNKKCVLETQCKKKSVGGRCEFTVHYDNLKPKSSDPVLARQLKTVMKPKVLGGWEDFVSDRKLGKKRMTGGAFEVALREVFKKNLAKSKVTVWDTGKRLSLSKLGFDIVPDLLIEKKGYPMSIISAKTWLGQEQLKETFGSAYFAKHNYPRKSIRVFMAVFLPTPNWNPKLEEACKEYIDGIYWVSQKPYIDSLLVQLREIYADVT